MHGIEIENYAKIYYLAEVVPVYKSLFMKNYISVHSYKKNFKEKI